MTLIITPEMVDMISKLGLAGAGGYLVIWITRYLDHSQREMNKQFSDQQRETNARHEKALEKIFSSMEKLADKYGDLRDCSVELKDCYMNHDAQAKVILDVSNRNTVRISEIESVLNMIRTNCGKCLHCQENAPPPASG